MHNSYDHFSMMIKKGNNKKRLIRKKKNNYKGKTKCSIKTRLS